MHDNDQTKRDPDMRPEARIELAFPVTDPTEHIEVDALIMRRPKTKDSLAAAKFKGGEAERGIFLLARLCGVSTDLIGELDEVDAQKLSDQLDAFRGRQSEN